MFQFPKLKFKYPSSPSETLQLLLIVLALYPQTVVFNSQVLAVILLLFFVSLLINFHAKAFSIFVFLQVILLSFTSLASSLLNNINAENPFKITSQLIILILSLSLISQLNTKSNLAFAYVVFRNIMVAACIFAILQLAGIAPSFSRVLSYAAKADSSLVDSLRPSAFFYEPAGFGFFLAYATGWSFVLRKYLTSVFFAIFLCLSASGVGFLTMASILICRVFLFFSSGYLNNYCRHFIFALKFKTRLFVTLLYPLLFITIILVIAANYSPEFSFLISRFSSYDILEKTTSYRIDAPQCLIYSDYSLSQVLFGHSVGSIEAVLNTCTATNETSNSSHLAFADIYYELGFLGFASYFSVIIFSISPILSKCKYTRLNYLAFVILFIGVVPYRSPQIFLPFIFSMVLLNTHFREAECSGS